MREAEVLTLGQKIQNEARGEIEKVQREYYLREQMKAIQKELGEKDQQAAEVEELRKKIDDAKMPPEADKQAKQELDRLSRLPERRGRVWRHPHLPGLDGDPAVVQDHRGQPGYRACARDPEHGPLTAWRMSRTASWSSWLCASCGWSARMRLKEPSKDQIRREREGVILCFIGPPGVGKTSLGQSIARAMGRKFIRASLGGVRDEAEIRGHRRTYIGALPGRILQSLRRIETRNPVFMLDEVDKLTFDFHGDPASALLEVLDPEQNSEFRDNYLEVAFDLSQVFFITTANTAETIPGPLYDRMEVIYLSGYTDNEKIAIAKGYLIPRQIRENGLRPDEVDFQRRSPCRRSSATIRVRPACAAWSARSARSAARPARASPRARATSSRSRLTWWRNSWSDPIFYGTEELNARTSVPGIVPGLAYTPFGGDVLFVEATQDARRARLPDHRLDRQCDAGVGAGGALLRALARGRDGDSHPSSSRRTICTCTSRPAPRPRTARLPA